MGFAQYLQRDYLYRPVALHVLTVGRYSNNGLSSIFAANGAPTLGGTAWPANNRALYVPINMPAYFTVARFLVGNGNNATGNVDVGLYNGAGTRLMSTGSTARSGTDVVQYFGVTDQTFPPGHYYLALVASSTTGTFQRASTAFADSAGILQENLGATTLPTSMTPTVGTGASAFFLFGFTQSDTL